MIAVADGISEECGTDLKVLGAMLDNLPTIKNVVLQVEGP